MRAAYTVASSVLWYPDASELRVAGAFARDRAIDGVQGLLDAIRILREAGPTEDALVRAKRSAVAKWRRALETDEGIATMLAQSAALGARPGDAFAFPRQIRGVTAAQLRSAEADRRFRRALGRGSSGHSVNRST